MDNEGFNVGGRVGDVPNVKSCIRNTDRKFAAGGEAAAIQTSVGGAKEGYNLPGTRVSDHGRPSFTRNEGATIRGESDVMTRGHKSNGVTVNVPLLNKTTFRRGHEASGNCGKKVDTGHGASLLSFDTLFYDMTAFPRPNVPQTNCVVVRSRGDRDGVR